MLFESWENVARRCASWGEAARRRARSEEILGTTKDRAYSPANLSNGGAYDIVCCAVVGLMFPGLEAGSDVCQRRGDASKKTDTNIFHCSSPKAHI